MVTRREFLKGSIATLILVPLVGCSDDDSPVATNGTDDTASCEGTSSTGSNSGGHIHTMCVADSDLSNPPAGGRTYTTSLDAGHTHTVSLTQADLQTIAGGGSVAVTSTGGNHTHDFTVEKAI